jgi:GR25 family glycosyltransferase involved in LPS biosynthesis
MISAYLINLDKEVERRVVSQESWPFTDIPFHLISAASQNEITAQYVTSGVAAIWQSHLKAMETFLNSGEDFGIILEDDYQINKIPQFHKILELGQMISADFIQFGFLTTGADVYLDKHLANYQTSFFRKVTSIPFLRHKFSNRLRVKEALISPSMLIPSQVLPGAHAYLISRNLARAITGSHGTQFLATDDFFMALAPMRSFRMYRAKKSCVSQRKVPSTVLARFRNYQ